MSFKRKYYKNKPYSKSGATPKPKSSKTKSGVKGQWVYVLSNASMPGMLKIGMTVKTPQERSRQLTSATGVPTPFVIEYCVEVSNAYEVEQEIHRRLAKYRVNRRREFFAIDLKTAVRIVNRVAKAKGHRLRTAIKFIAAAGQLVLGVGVIGAAFTYRAEIAEILSLVNI